MADQLLVTVMVRFAAMAPPPLKLKLLKRKLAANTPAAVGVPVNSKAVPVELAVRLKPGGSPVALLTEIGVGKPISAN